MRVSPPALWICSPKKTKRHKTSLAEGRLISSLWSREPGLLLVHIILEQQVSLSSARAALVKLSRTGLGSSHQLKPLSLTDEEMRACYFSRQKAGYASSLPGLYFVKQLWFGPDWNAAGCDSEAGIKKKWKVLATDGGCNSMMAFGTGLIVFH